MKKGMVMQNRSIQNARWSKKTGQRVARVLSYVDRDAIIGAERFIEV